MRVERIAEARGTVVLYFGERPAALDRVTFVSCVAYHRGDVLFCKWRDTGVWVLPGGRLEAAEAPVAAAERELLEETGARWRDVQVLCYLHCFMFDAEYWGIAYVGEVETLGDRLDRAEVSAVRAFSAFPKNNGAASPFENQNRALYAAAMRRRACVL